MARAHVENIVTDKLYLVSAGLVIIMFLHMINNCMLSMKYEGWRPPPSGPLPTSPAGPCLPPPLSYHPYHTTLA